MKNLVLLFTLLIVSSISIGQTTADTSSATKYFYCELRVNITNMGNKTKIYPDFGDETKIFKDEAMKEAETEKIKKFTSRVDALNYMTDNGWEYVESYGFAPEIGYQYYFYVLRKKKNL
jgi:hypothetical protein